MGKSKSKWHYEFDDEYDIDSYHQEFQHKKKKLRKKYDEEDDFYHR